jgi:hypothetical protein
MTASAYTRPTQPALAKAFDAELRKGREIRYADDQQLVVWRQNRWGGGCCLLLILLGLLTAFIVPIILLLLGALAPGGHIVTFTVKPNGKLNLKIHRGK